MIMMISSRSLARFVFESFAGAHAKIQLMLQYSRSAGDTVWVPEMDIKLQLRGFKSVTCTPRRRVVEGFEN